MKVKLVIDRNEKLPVRAIPALMTELLSRLIRAFSECTLTIKLASNDGLTVYGGDKQLVEDILQKTWESADEWFY